MVKTVQSSNWVRMVDWMRSSVSRSMAAVASSRMRILVFLRRARARHTSCLWPTLSTQRHRRKMREKRKLGPPRPFHPSVNPHPPEVLSALRALQLQLGRLVADKPVEVRVLQSFPHFFIVVLVKGVQVHPQSAWEQNRLLRRRKHFSDWPLALNWKFLLHFKVPD